MTRIRILALPLAALAVLLAAALAAPATATGDKVSICHRTASDTNPYVFITVSRSALQAHLDDGHGHPAKTWKSDGIWRGVPHLEGSAKDDYVATSEADCEDTTTWTPTPTPEQTPPTPAPTPTSSAGPTATPSTPSPTVTPAPSVTSTPSLAVTPTPTASPTPNPIATPNPTPPNTATLTLIERNPSGSLAIVVGLLLTGAGVLGLAKGRRR